MFKNQKQNANFYENFRLLISKDIKIRTLGSDWADRETMLPASMTTRNTMTQKNQAKNLKRNNIRKDLKEYTYLGCPLTKNRSPWCFRICKPDIDGTGFCGRVAPHGFKSRIQLGIDDFVKRQSNSFTEQGTQKTTENKDA